MIIRKTLKYLIAIPLGIIASFSAIAQEMPTGNLIVNTECSIKEGHTVDEVIQVARAVDSTVEGGPNLIFYRRPIAGSTFPANFLLRVVYWDNLAHWAASPGPAPSGAGNQLAELLDCDNVNRSFWINRNVGQGAAYANGENDQSLVASRRCRVKPGSTIEELYAGLTELNAPYGAQGNTTLMQLSQRFMGASQGVDMGTLVTIRLIGENAVGLAERIDMTSKGAGTPPDAPVENCGDWGLWTSYVTHWGI